MNEVQATSLRRAWPLWLILLLFSLLAGSIALRRGPLAPRRETDFFGYARRASGDYLQISGWHPPGYSLALRPFLGAGCSAESAGLIVSFLAGLVLIGSTWVLLRRELSARSSFLGTAVVALSPPLVLASTTRLSDCLAAACFALALTLASKARPGMLSWTLAGAAVGAATLTRSVFVVALLLPALFFVARGRAAGSVRDVLGFGLGFLLVDGPWLLTLARDRGSPFWSHHHLNLAFALEEGGGTDWSDLPLPGEHSSFVDVVRRHPRLFVLHVGRRALELPGQSLSMLSPLALLLVPLGFARWLRGIRPATAAWVLASGLYAGALLLAWHDVRYLLALLPLLALWIALGLGALPARLSFRATSPLARLNAARLRTPCAMLLILLLLGSTIIQARRMRGASGERFSNAGSWLKGQGAGARILAHKPHTAFYAEAKHLDFRSDARLHRLPLAELGAVLARLRPDYFVLDRQMAGESFPHLLPVLDPASRLPRWGLQVAWQEAGLTVFRYVPAEQAGPELPGAE